MQLSMPGIEPPLSSRPAAVEARVCLTPEGRIHHAEIEVRSITGALLHAVAVPGSLFALPRNASSWLADSVLQLLEEACQPFPDA